MPDRFGKTRRGNEEKGCLRQPSFLADQAVGALKPTVLNSIFSAVANSIAGHEELYHDSAKSFPGGHFLSASRSLSVAVKSGLLIVNI
jgi:hypothetical protein